MTISVKPLGNRVVVEPIEQDDVTASGIVLPDTAKEKPQQGMILAAGPGERDCQLYLQKRLDALGFATDLWDPDGPALYKKYEGRAGANKGRTFDGRPSG